MSVKEQSALRAEVIAKLQPDRLGSKVAKVGAWVVALEGGEEEQLERHLGQLLAGQVEVRRERVRRSLEGELSMPAGFRLRTCLCTVLTKVALFHRAGQASCGSVARCGQGSLAGRTPSLTPRALYRCAQLCHHQRESLCD